MIVVYYLARDDESDQIVEDSFIILGTLTERFLAREQLQARIEGSVLDMCKNYGLILIAMDSCPEIIYRLGLWRPKWGTDNSSPPDGIPLDKWRNRLKSTDELKAYRAGLVRGRGPNSN
jgi:hypothetical protein